MDMSGGHSWSAHAAGLIQWFEQRQVELPTTPFQLNAWTHVLHPLTFYAALRRDISLGPQSPRAAVLVEELAELFAWQRQALAPTKPWGSGQLH